MGHFPVAGLAIRNRRDAVIAPPRFLRQDYERWHPAVPHDDAMSIRDNVGFFQAVRSVLVKSVTQQHRPKQDLVNAIRQIVSLISRSSLMSFWPKSVTFLRRT